MSDKGCILVYNEEDQRRIIEQYASNAMGRIGGLMSRKESEIIECSMTHALAKGYYQYGDYSFHQGLTYLKDRTIKSLSSAVFYQSAYSHYEFETRQRLS